MMEVCEARPSSGEGDERQWRLWPRAPLKACEQLRGQHPWGAGWPLAAAAAAAAEVFLASAWSFLTLQPLPRLLLKGKVEAMGSGGSRLRSCGGTSPLLEWSVGEAVAAAAAAPGRGSESPSLFPRLGKLESWSLSSSCLQHGGGGCTSRDLGRFKTSLPQLPPHQPWPRLQRPQEEAAFLRIICLLPILLPPLPDLWLLRRSRPSRCNHPAAAAAAIAQLQSRAKQQQSEGHQLPPSAEPFPSCRRRPTTSSFCHLSPPFSSATDSQT